MHTLFVYAGATKDHTGNVRLTCVKYVSGYLHETLSHLMFNYLYVATCHTRSKTLGNSLSFTLLISGG